MSVPYKSKKFWLISGISALVLALLSFLIWFLIPPNWHYPERVEVHLSLDEMATHAEFICYGTVTSEEEPFYFSSIEDNPYGWGYYAHIQPDRTLKGDASVTDFIAAQGYHREGKEVYAAYPESITGFPLRTGDQVVMFMWTLSDGTMEPGGFCVMRNGIVHINEWITKTNDIPDNLQMPLEDFLALIESKL